MSDKMMKIAGLGEDGTAKPFRTENDGSIVLGQKNRSSEEIVVVNLLEIRDTNSTVRTIDLSKYKKTRWKVFSTLDQPPTLRFSVNRKEDVSTSHLPYIWNGTDWVDEDIRTLKIEREGRVYDVTSKFKWLEWGRKIHVSIRCDIAPTVGSLTIVIEGVPN